MSDDKLNVGVSVKRVSPSEWEAEVKEFKLSAIGESIEEAISEMIPKVEKHLKEMFASPRSVSAELDGIVAKATLSITVPDPSIRSLDEFDKNEDEPEE